MPCVCCGDIQVRDEKDKLLMEEKTLHGDLNGVIPVVLFQRHYYDAVFYVNEVLMEMRLKEQARNEL